MTERTLSHSQLESWHHCQLKWAHHYVYHTPEAPSDALVLGSAFHAALEADGQRLIATGGRSGFYLPVLAARFAEALDQQTAASDPEGLLHDRLPDLRVRGLAMLRTYVEHIRDRGDAPDLRYRPFAVEREITVDVPDSGAAQLRFTGHLDALTHPGGNSAQTAIVDFKTANKPWQRGIEHDKPQATAYAWLLSQQPDVPLAERQRVTFIVFPTVPDPTATGMPEGLTAYRCEPQVRPTVRTAYDIVRWLRGVTQAAEDITAACASGTFAPSAGPLCGWCPVAYACGPGQGWLAMKGRTPQPAIAAFGRTERARAAVSVLRTAGVPTAPPADEPSSVAS